MAVYTYEDVIPTRISNTTMQKLFINGVFQQYVIAPVSGYVLHDKGRDWPDEDIETGEETIMLGFTRGTTTCGANYDFTENPREFYALPESDVPADQIFGSGNDPEIM